MALTSKNKTLVIGAGAFGTAIAACIHSSTNPVTIISREGANFDALKRHDTLKQCKMEIFTQFNSCLSEFKLIILAIPCQSLRNVSEWMLKHWNKTSNSQSNNSAKLNIISAAKGIEQKTLMLPSQILESFWKENAAIGTLSGPSFAKEMLLGLPTCVVVASKDRELLNIASKLLHSPYFRIYDSKDVIGVEIAGALKNIIAMVAGAVDGLKLGNNARAAVITRGLAEIVRIGVKLGADPITFLGLSGVGDLILTCTGDLSRNRQFGLRMSQGESKEEIIRSMIQVIEGIATANSANELCIKHGVETSIINTAYRVLYENTPIKSAVSLLIERQQGSEFHW
jgi:glycerol-3-phosphate dehydrogenase (NAD(P)+)